MCILPFFILPSIMLAMYQGLVDINFLNVPYFAELHRVSGVGMDSNGLGISIFLLFPLSVLAIILNKELWKRILFSVFSILLLWCLFLSGTRTGLIGILLFLIILPLILPWSNNGLLRRWRFFLAISIIVNFLIVGGFLLINHGQNSVTLLKRLEVDYHDLKKDGFKAIIEKSGRYELGLQALRLTKMSPLSGWGPGGFYHNLHNIRFRNGKMTYFRFDNANNHYLQMTSELGIIGGGLNLFLHILPLWMAFRIRNQIPDHNERLAVGVVFSTIVIMMFLYLTGPHTMARSVLWILVVMLSFLFITALRYGYTFKPLSAKFIWVFSILTILFTWGTYNNAFGKEGYRARQKADWWLYKYEKNCYEYERWPKGPVRWCKNDAFLQIPVKRGRPFPEEVTISLCVRNPDIKTRPVEVSYGGKSGLQNRIIMKDYSWKTLRIPVTEDHMFEHMGPDGVLRRYFILSLDISRTWVPKEWGVNEDTRELGVAVLTPYLLR
jgi:O-antigen ligase